MPPGHTERVDTAVRDDALDDEVARVRAGRARRRRAAPMTRRVRPWRLAAVVGVVALVVSVAACSDDKPARPTTSGIPGRGPYVVVDRAPAGWHVESMGPAGRLDRPPLRPVDGVAVFSRDHVAYFARPVGLQWDDANRPPRVDVAATDGREVYEFQDTGGHLLVRRSGTLVEVWTEHGASEGLADFAAAVSMDLTSAGAPFQRVGRLDSDWSVSGTAIDVNLARPDHRTGMMLTIMSTTSSEMAALHELLIDDPATSFKTESSVYDIDRYPKPTKLDVGDGQTAWFGMLGARYAALLIDGDPGVALITYAFNAQHAAEVRDQLAAVVPGLRRITSDDLARRSRDLLSIQLRSARRRMVAGRQVLWEQLKGGRLRLLTVDPTPSFAGPDTARTRSADAACLAVVLSAPYVSTHDGCVVEEPVMSVGEVRTDQRSGITAREAWGLVDDDVAAVELRDGATVVAKARLIDLDRQALGRRRVFIVDYEPIFPSTSTLELVALDRNDRVLRTVARDFLGTFEARPGDPRWR